MNSTPVEEKALIKALENTTIHYFDYDVKNGIVSIPQRTCARFRCKEFYANMPYSFADDFVYEKDRDMFIDLYREIINGEETAHAIFRNKDGNRWCRVTLTVTERDENAAAAKAVGIIEDLSGSKKQEMRYIQWIDAMSDIYRNYCYINLAEKTCQNFEKGSDKSADNLPRQNINELVKSHCEKYVHPDDRAEYMKKLNTEYIISQLSGENKNYSLEYRQTDENGVLHWVRGMMILSDAFDDGTPHHAIYTVRYIDKEVEEKALLESSIKLMRDTYYRIGCINLDTNSMRTITISENERHEAPGFFEDFDHAVRDFAENYVLKEYREKFLNVMLPSRMKAIFDIGSDYIDITYRRLESGVPKWVRTELIPLQDYSPKNRRVMWYVKNISHEKAAEERLTQKLLQMNNDINLRLETILEGISGGFVINGDDENYTYKHVSESAAALFGYTVDEFIDSRQQSAIKNVYPPDLEHTLAAVKKELNVGSTYSLKYRVMCKDGSIKWIVDSGKKVTAEDGSILHYCFYHDVTELEERNQELRNTLTILNQMVKSLSCGIFSYRLPRREILALNDEALRIFDVDTHNADMINIGKVMRDKILPEDSAAMRSSVLGIKEPGDRTSYEFRIRHRDGKIYRIQANSSLLEFEDGSKFILSSMQDITEQFELTETVREERSQYRDALLTNCEYAYSFDVTDGRVTEEYVTRHGVNPFQKLGISLPIQFDSFIEKCIEGFKLQFLEDGMREDLSREAMLKKYANGERTTEVEYFSETSNLYTRVTVLLSRSTRTGHIVAVVVGSDTTKNRRAEAQTKQALLDAYESARRANSAKSDFLSRMSHDIRTPMNAIIGMTAIAGTHLDDRDRVADCLNKITVSSGHLLSLINEVLDMTKIESGKVDLNEEDFNLSDLVDTLISMVRPQIKSKEQNLKVRINDVVHEKVIGDKLRIQQSFLNLMSNAIKYTPVGGNINLYISEKKHTSAHVGRYEFVFEDTGIGMSPDFVEHIFEPFSRAADSRVTKEQGTGLGMSITDNLVRMMNGNIKVESELGKGSRFTVTISLKLQDTEELSYSAFENLSVLFADDDESTCENACHMLDEMGMKGEWVTCGKKAVEKVVKRHEENDDYFAVILDWKMPGMDGIQVTKEIRRLVGPDVPIIIISAYDWSDIELEARAAGADAFVGKPLFKSRLAHLFHDILSGEDDSAPENDADGLMKEDFSGKRVLLVEDNELNAEIAQELLEMTGLEVEWAENGQVAVDMFSNSPNGYYQMIFMDIQMPVMNGNEAARAIRALSRRDARGVPIVAMTANAFSEDVQASKNAGMNEHIPKPLDLKQLGKTLRKWLY